MYWSNVHSCYSPFFVFNSRLSSVSLHRLTSTVLLLLAFVFEIVLHTFVSAHTPFFYVAPHPHTGAHGRWKHQTNRTWIMQCEFLLFWSFLRIESIYRPLHFFFALLILSNTNTYRYICMRRWRPMRTNEPTIIFVCRLTKPIWRIKIQNIWIANRSISNETIGLINWLCKPTDGLMASTIEFLSKSMENLLDWLPTATTEVLAHSTRSSSNIN